MDKGKQNIKFFRAKEDVLHLILNVMFGRDTLSDRNYVWLVNSERRSGHVMLTGIIDNTYHWSIDEINIITRIIPH